MAKQIATQLTEELLPLLRDEYLVLLTTIDHEQTVPNVSAVSWVYAPNEQTIRLAIDGRSRILDNIRHNQDVTLSVVGAGSCYAIHGQAHVAQERMDGNPLKLARVDVRVQAVKDVMFYGARITSDPEYEKTYDEEAAAKLDSQVFSGLKASK